MPFSTGSLEALAAALAHMSGATALCKRSLLSSREVGDIIGLPIPLLHHVLSLAELHDVAF